MTTDFSINNPKITPAIRPDGTVDDNDRVEIGPTAKAFALWNNLGLTPPNVNRMRTTRRKRVVAQLHQRNLGGVILFDPLNIRYAIGADNMAVWTMHNAVRAVFVGADGRTILWEMKRQRHITAHLKEIDEVREGGAGTIYFEAGDLHQDKAKAFAAELADVLRLHGQGNTRLGIDTMPSDIVTALTLTGVDTCYGQPAMEHARLIKCEDEIAAMRCAIASCESAIAAMEEALQPGIAECELWSILHRENIAMGGEWIETRLLASGPRTNPWMQECGPRVINSGELVAFDTDLVGNYGMCADISRTWLCGDVPASAEQIQLYRGAYEHIQDNMELLKPGRSFSEITNMAKPIPEEFVARRYVAMFHGIGLCDEFPCINYVQDYTPGAFDYELQPGMTLCVEAYFGHEGGTQGVKLEDQVLITETGYENLTSYPFDNRLLGN